MATHTAAPAAAQLPVVGQARGRLRGTVAVVADVAGVALALPAVALSVAWTGGGQEVGSKTGIVCSGYTSDVGTAGNIAFSAKPRPGTHRSSKRGVELLFKER